MNKELRRISIATLAMFLALFVSTSVIQVFAVDDLRAADPRTAKLFARAGMGLCQGRVCGYATAALVAARCGREVTTEDLAGTSARPIAQPVPLSVLAAPRPATPQEHGP